MNERIKELANIAACRNIKTSPAVASDIADWAVIEKFAELIVWECAQVADNSNQLKNRSVGVSVGDAVLKNFGVESKSSIPIAIEPHTCPYKTELYGDETLCTCSPEQEHECAMDV